jgi:AraC-like DNA-binding protein
MRNHKDIENATIESIAQKYRLPHIGNDVLLMESLRMLPAVMEARRLSLCLFIGVCTSGVVTLTVNGQRRAAVDNNAMVVTEESVVSNLRHSDDFDGMGVFISYTLLQDILCDVHNMSDLFLLTHNYPVFELHSDETSALRGYFNSIGRHIVRENHRHRLEVARLTLLTMIYDMSEAIDRTISEGLKDERQSRSERIFVEFIQRVRTHFKQHRQVQWYAEQMGITPKYLSEVVSSSSRRTPNEWIDKFVTAEMRNQLRHTDKRISDIAVEMGFTTQSFFGKYFKENVGVSPTDYRNGIEPKL